MTNTDIQILNWNTCLENNCEKNCDRKAHIVCTCKKEKKIPLLELYFVRYQREKFGTKAILQIAGIDHIDTRKQNKKNKRLSIENQVSQIKK